MTVAIETRLSTQNKFFLCRKESPLHVAMIKEVADRGFHAFWPFDSERKFRRKRKNAAKNLKFGEK